MINVLIKTDTRYPVNRKIVKRAVEETFQKFKIDADFEVSIFVAGARKMKKLTADFLGDGKKHEILTFALNEESPEKALLRDQKDFGLSLGQVSSGRQGFVNPPDGVLRLGDIILCWPDVLLLASADDVMIDEAVYDLVCHGVEHLLGYSHQE